MARKASPRKPTLALPKPFARSPTARGKPARGLSAPEAADAAQQGLLQLSFARHAHGYGFLAAAAFLLNAVLLLTLGGQAQALPLPRSVTTNMVLWLLPAVAGALASWDAVRLKREPYRRHYVSTHFGTSAAGMVLFFIVAFAIILLMQQSLPEALVPWVYPLTVAGIPLTIISMGMTWQGLGLRKVGSFAAALVMPILMVLLVLGGARITDPSGAPDLGGIRLFVLTFVIGALTSEIAGSLLHLIASSTSVNQREILKADNSKVALIQQDYQKKREALDYKERALRGREAHLEALQQELEDQAKELKGKFSDVTARENAIEKGTKDLRDIDRKVASARAEIEAKAEEIRLRDADISTLKTEHEKMRQTLNAREASLAEREKEVKRTSIELTSQLRSSETKVKSVEEREARLQELEKSFDSKRTSLLKKEKDLELKDSELRLRGEQVEATHGGADATRIRELKEWEKKILAKEKELGKQEVELKTMETRLKERYENATRIEKQIQGQRRMFDDRESEYVSREKKISDQEAALRERSTEIERQASAVEEAQHQLDDKTKKYAELFKDTKMKEAAAGSNEADTRRQKENLDSRERKLHEMQTNLQAEIKRLNEENRNLLEKAKEIEERESDLQLKSLELENKTREGRAPGMRDMGREGQLEEWERRLREREEDLKRRTYQKEKEMEMREGAVKARITTAAGEAEAEEAIAVEKKADRVKTGTPRLDDLLYGGLPFNSNVLFVGQLDEEFKKKHPYFRLAYMTLSSSITQADEREAMSFVQRLVNRLRQTKAVSAIALERGMHTDQTLEALEHMVDGAIHFKSDKQKTALQVVGLGEVQTHDWVPYKFTNKALMIGSFQLERIR